MKIWNLPDQVVRLAVLLGVVTAVLILARNRFVPDTFGELGHYRASAVKIIADQDIRYAGWQVCVDCHPDQGAARSGSYHRTLSCEVCHGPAEDHVDDQENHRPLIPRQRGEACLFCHNYLPSRPTGFPQIIERIHNPMVPCVDCHDPHDPTPPQVPESCSACHARIARTKAISHHREIDCETCHETDSEHRENPRANLPKKPSTREFCARCHGLGAESPLNIPRIDMSQHGGSYLCWQCHYPHFPGS